MRNNRKALVLLTFLALLVIVAPAVSAVTLTPSTATSYLGMPVGYTASGLNSSLTYYVELGGTEVLSDLTPTTTGTLAISVSSSVAGTFLVAVYDTATDTLQASANLVVQDMFAMVMPMVVLIVGFTILFGVIKELKF
jgi:hypothetical protein